MYSFKKSEKKLLNTLKIVFLQEKNSSVSSYLFESFSQQAKE